MLSGVQEAKKAGVGNYSALFRVLVLVLVVAQRPCLP